VEQPSGTENDLKAFVSFPMGMIRFFLINKKSSHFSYIIFRLLGHIYLILQEYTAPYLPISAFLSIQRV
jgi:hypothetical protein